MSNNNKSQATSKDFMLSGGCAGLTYWMVVYPLDTIKTNMQMNKTFY